jgi:hypothetical protein
MLYPRYVSTWQIEEKYQRKNEKKFKKIFIDISVIYARYNIHLG